MTYWQNTCTCMYICILDRIAKNGQWLASFVSRPIPSFSMVNSLKQKGVVHEILCMTCSWYNKPSQINQPHAMPLNLPEAWVHLARGCCHTWGYGSYKDQAINFNLELQYLHTLRNWLKYLWLRLFLSITYNRHALNETAYLDSMQALVEQDIMLMGPRLS